MNKDLTDDLLNALTDDIRDVKKDTTAIIKQLKEGGEEIQSSPKDDYSIRLQTLDRKLDSLGRTIEQLPDDFVDGIDGKMSRLFDIQRNHLKRVIDDGIKESLQPTKQNQASVPWYSTSLVRVFVIPIVSFFIGAFFMFYLQPAPQQANRETEYNAVIWMLSKALPPEKYKELYVIINTRETRDSVITAYQNRKK